MRVFGRLLLVLLALLLLAWASHLRDTRLLDLRAAALPVIGGLAILLALAAWRWCGRWLRTGLLVAVALALGMAAASTLCFQADRAAVLALTPGSPRLPPGIGRHLVIGYDRPEDLHALIDRGLVGGILIGARNMRGKGFAALQAEVSALQARQRAAGQPPLLVMADQEGGLVSRLSPPLPRQPPLRQVVSTLADAAEIEAAADAYGAVQGEGLAALGVSVNLSPVVDLAPPEADGGNFDLNTRIGARAIGQSPDVVIAAARGYLRGLRRHGVRATLKHFPGIGRAQGDSHIVAVRLDLPAAELAANELRPFAALAGEPGLMVMLSHVIVPAIDPQRPVSASKPAVDGVLRGQLGFTGPAVTDDLSMAAALSDGVCAAVFQSFDAGVDLLLFGWDPELAIEGIACLLDRQDPRAPAAADRLARFAAR